MASVGIFLYIAELAMNPHYTYDNSYETYLSKVSEQILRRTLTSRMGSKESAWVNGTSFAYINVAKVPTAKKLAKASCKLLWWKPQLNLKLQYALCSPIYTQYFCRCFQHCCTWTTNEVAPIAVHCL